MAEDDAEVDLAVAAAKSQATEAAVLACEKSIQAHGGIGFTWEHPLHRYYKRALWLEGALGYGREYRAEVAASLLSS
jgi:acyl-CoA dehydrogenase